ncbi:MAG: AsnC family transcriptional regulator [Caulobacteraceae bacterium]|nr:AsnC family transcriptional regulator [Caulobacteraceae bacterium]
MIDNVDRDLLDVLRRDPRVSNRAIAQALSLSETTIGVRLERLSGNNIARVIAQRDFRALGWTLSALCDVYLKDVDPEEVMARLHASPNVVTIYKMAGPPELVVKVAARDIEELTRLTLGVIGGDPGARRVDVQLCLGYGHVRAGFGNLESPRGPGPDSGGDLETRIAEILARDGRISNREVGRLLGVAEATVRSRISALQQKGMLRYILICNPERVGYAALAFLRLRVQLPQLGALTARLSQHPWVFGATQIAAPHNLVVSIYAPSWPEAFELCGQVMRHSPDIEDPVVRPAVSFARHRYDLTSIPASASAG